MELNLKITDNELINYLNQIDNDKQNERIQELLKLSLTIIRSSGIIVQDNTLPNLLNKQIDLLSLLTGQSNNPVKKGQLGENIVENALNTYCSKYGISFNNTTKTSHQTDYMLSFKHNSKVYNILLEIKHYKNSVPKKEITKFKSDLINVSNNNNSIDTINSTHGILCSLTSGIVYKHQFSWKKNKNKNIIMYLPNSGTDCLLLVYSIWFLKSLIINEEKYQYNTENSIDKLNFKIIETHLNNLKLTIDNIRNIQKNLNQFESNLKSMIDNNFNGIRTQLIDLNVELINSIKNLENLHSENLL